MIVVKLPSETKNTKLSFAHLKTNLAKVSFRQNKTLMIVFLNLNIIYA